MDFIGILVNVTEKQEGTDKNGQHWYRKTAVFQTVEHYSKNVAVTCMNHVCDVLGNYQVGNLVKVSIDAESRFYEGKYYTELRAWSLKPAVTIPRQNAETAPLQTNKPAPDTNTPADLEPTFA